MAGTTLDKIPPALGLNGSELFWAYQPGPTPVTPWIGVSVTPGQLTQYLKYGPSVPYVATTMCQLLAALSTQGVLVTLFDALPSDITNPYNIAYNHANYITIGDPFITGFLQPTLGYSQADVYNLFNLAAAVPAYATGTPTMRQLIAALGSQAVLVSVVQALTSDITNSYNIAWNHANYMPLTDPFITGFLQAAIGYTSVQMAALFAAALAFPV